VRDIPKRVKRLLREYASAAHEKELRRALLPLADAFKRIGASEYILTTQNYLYHVSERALPSMLTCQQANDEYPAIGTIAYRYALLDQIKNTIPEPPKRESPVVELGKDSLEIDINTPLLDVYQKLIDLDSRVRWVLGLKSTGRDITLELAEDLLQAFDALGDRALGGRERRAGRRPRR
jgi:hypothetical protein